MTESQFNSALAIYNPNGGNRTGKIYDITANARDLTVSGGGGARIKADGVVEAVDYYNIIPYTPVTTGWTLTNVTASESASKESTITENTTTGNHNAFLYFATTQAATRTVQVELKKVDSRYVVFGHTPTSYLIYDFDTNTVVSNTLSTSNYAQNIEVRADGWVKISFFIGHQTTASSRNILIGLSPDGTTVSYAGTGKSVKFRKIQVVASVDSTIDVLPYQHNTGAAAFPKIDYSTGQAAFLIEPTRTNYFVTPAKDLAGAASLTTGITGAANEAAVFSDANTTGHSNYAFLTTGMPSTGPKKISGWLLKDTNVSRFPLILFYENTSSKSAGEGVVFNTQTGAFRKLYSTAGVSINVIDRGLWWEIVALLTSTFDRGYFEIFPAYTADFNVNGQVATTGSATVGYIGMTVSNVVNETPIIPSGAVVTRTSSEYTGSFTLPTSYSLFLEIENGVIEGSLGGLLFDKDGSLTSELLLIANYSDGHYWITTRGGTVNQVNFTTASNPIGQKSKILIDFVEGGRSAIFFNGAKVAEIASGSITPKINRFISKYTTNQFYGRFFKMEFLSNKTDAEAITLTTL